MKNEFKVVFPDIPKVFMIKGLTKEMNETYNAMLEFYEINAKHSKAKYDAFISAGFKPEEALFLSK